MDGITHHFLFPKITSATASVATSAALAAAQARLALQTRDASMILLRIAASVLLMLAVFQLPQHALKTRNVLQARYA